MAMMAAATGPSNCSFASLFRRGASRGNAAFCSTTEAPKPRRQLLRRKSSTGTNRDEVIRNQDRTQAKAGVERFFSCILPLAVPAGLPCSPVLSSSSLGRSMVHLVLLYASRRAAQDFSFRFVWYVFAACGNSLNYQLLLLGIVLTC